MTIYTAKFIGRIAGAIGIFYPITTQIEAKNRDSARIALYDRFEDIHKLELKKIK